MQDQAKIANASDMGKASWYIWLLEQSNVTKDTVNIQHLVMLFPLLCINYISNLMLKDVLCLSSVGYSCVLIYLTV